MKTSEKCANGCIPSSPRVGCPVHGPVRVGPFEVVVDARLGPGDFYFLAKPPEPAKCGCAWAPDEDETHADSCPLANPPPPPEPAPSKWLVKPGEWFKKERDDLRAQLAAAQAEKEQLTKLRQQALWEVGRFQGLHAEANGKLQAAIKAKEEAETRLQKQIDEGPMTHSNGTLSFLGKRWVPQEERDAERKRADELQRQITEDTQRLDTWSARVVKAEATAGALRAALEGIRNHSLTIENADFRAREALAAPPHGKDAGEEMTPTEWKHADGAMRVLEAERDEALQRRDNFRDYAERLEAQRDDLQARLTEAEGLLRTAYSLVPSGGWSPLTELRLEWHSALEAFLKKPPEGGT